MHSLFSIEDLAETFWAASAQALSPASMASAAPPGMSRSQSEWAFEKFIEEMNASGSAFSALESAIAPSSGQSQPSVSENEKAGRGDDVLGNKMLRDGGHVRDRHQHDHDRGNHIQSIGASSALPVDTEHYQALLKSKLDLACAAALALRASTMKPENVAATSEAGKQPEQSASHAQGSPTVHSEPIASPVSASPLPATRKKPGLQAKQASSGSSREDSDDDELELDTEITDNMDPADVKRARRMLSNRESARRSRRRKQEQMTELETQVGQLRVEHSSFLKRLSDVNHKCDEAAVENRILKADIETLRAKVKMAEETVKRVTGMNPLLLARTNVGVPYAGSQMTACTIQAPPKANQHLKPPNPNTAPSAPDQRSDTSFPSSTIVPPSVNTVSNPGGQNVAGPSHFQHSVSANHVQKPVGLSGSRSHVNPRANPGGPIPGWNPGMMNHAASTANPQK